MTNRQLLAVALGGIAVWMMLSRRAAAAGQNIAVQPLGGAAALLSPIQAKYIVNAPAPADLRDTAYI